MKKVSTFLVGVSTLFGAQVASATSYTPGVHVFSGPVTVQKDLGAYDCELTVTVTVPSSGDSATATADLSGDFPCGAINISGTATVSASLPNLTLTGLTITPPLSWGVCTGSITVAWQGNGPPSPREVVLSVPLSNSTATAGADCKMDGTLQQVSGGPLNIS